MQDTLDLLDANGIRHVGIKNGQLLELEAKGLKMVFLAHNLVKEKIAPDNVSTQSEVVESVKEAKGKGDIIIVSIHWGAEYVSKPSPSQIRFARELIDSGADVILGHHSHVLQGVERYGKGVIAYSLGNFVFDTHHEKTRESAILSLEISKDGVIGARPIPVFINDSYQPEVAQAEKARSIISKVEKLSSDLEKEDLSDFEKKTEVHEKEVRLKLQEYGKESRMYFLKNVHRYPKGMLPHLFMKSIRRRTGLK
jgi:poly-gamma-glutamate synthesis protein (capsule biosynthesis protein)